MIMTKSFLKFHSFSDFKIYRRHDFVSGMKDKILNMNVVEY